MISNYPYDLSVGSADEYNELIAEIKFSNKFGMIISQEKKEGRYEISLHSFSNNSADDFDYCKNIDENKVPLSAFQESIETAISELRRLARAT